MNQPNLKEKIVQCNLDLVTLLVSAKTVAKLHNVTNVCFIKIRSKHSNNTLLSLLRIFMKQTLGQNHFGNKTLFYSDKHNGMADF